MKSQFRIAIFSSLFVALLASCASQGVSSSPAASSSSSSSDSSSSAVSSSPASRRLSKKTVSTYFLTPTLQTPLNFYFLSGVDDIPYFPVSSITDFLTGINGQTSSGVLVSQKDKVFTLTRSDNATAGGDLISTIDFNTGKVGFLNYSGFFARYYLQASSEVCLMPHTDSEGRNVYLQRNPAKTYARKGTAVSLDLASHNIPMIYEDGEGYLPLQTITDLYLVPIGLNTYFNGTNAFFVQGNSVASVFPDQYYTTQTSVKQRSQALAEYTYNELTFALDLLYGLKEEHQFSSFDTYLTEQGYKQDLLSLDPITSSHALVKLIRSDIADFHSEIVSTNPYCYKNAEDTGLTEINANASSPSYDAFWDLQKVYSNARKAVYEGLPQYEEIGDTAYVSFDEFNAPNAVEHYGAGNAATKASVDSAGIIQYAHSQIMRDSTPIKNVVLDLSCNGGGIIDMAAYTLAWMLGQATLPSGNIIDGAKSECVYHADVNLDYVFDEKDTIASKRLFCLTSPFSFSCGNLVPSLLKSSSKVTMLGKTSGGGACSVLNMATADGTSFNISGFRKFFNVKNGIFYSNDEGASPDYEIASPEAFYDRTSLTKMIDAIL